MIRKVNMTANYDCENDWNDDDYNVKITKMMMMMMFMAITMIIMMIRSE